MDNLCSGSVLAEGVAVAVSQAESVTVGLTKSGHRTCNEVDKVLEIQHDIRVLRDASALNGLVIDDLTAAGWAAKGRVRDCTRISLLKQNPLKEVVSSAWT